MHHRFSTHSKFSARDITEVIKKQSHPSSPLLQWRAVGILALRGIMTSPAGLCRLRNRNVLLGIVRLQTSWTIQCSSAQANSQLKCLFGKTEPYLSRKVIYFASEFPKMKTMKILFQSLCYFSLFLTNKFLLEGIVLPRNLIDDLRKQIFPIFLFLGFFTTLSH